MRHENPSTTLRSRSLAVALATEGNNFNLIRLVAALSVIYGHAYAVTGQVGQDIVLRNIGYRFIGGIAVDIFFIISGFLITASMERRASIPEFVASRVLRIYPPLIVCVGLSAFVLGPIVTTAAQYWTSETFSYFWHNSTMTQVLLYLPGVFENHPQKGAVNGPLWSILMELRLYVVTALLFLLGILRRRVVFNALFLFLITLYFLNPQLEIPWVLPWNSPWHRSLVLLYFTGTFYYLNADKIPLNPFILLALLFFAASLHGESEPKYVIGYNLLLPYLVMMVAFAPGLLWFNRLGDYSYGSYLYGWPVAQTVYWVNPTLTALQSAAWSISITLLLAIASWHLIEKRALGLKEPFGQLYSTCVGWVRDRLSDRGRHG